jgi:hypothetical protein
MADLSDSAEIKAAMRKATSETISDAGERDFNIAGERGEIFDIKLDKMAEEVWGPDNIFYFLYKRQSEVTHGQWKVISKYHLKKIT